MNDFLIVTVSTHRPTEWYYTYDAFYKSVEGFEVLVLDRQYTQYVGLGSKVKGVYKAIKQGLVNKPYILFVDSWDLFFAVSPQKLFEKWKWEFDSVLTISAEKNCFPDDLKKEYDEINGILKYRYLNSGMIIGKTSDMLELLEYMEPDKIVDDYRMENGQNFHTNDQFLYQQSFLDQPIPMRLDYYQKLCQTLHDINIDEFEFANNGIRNKITGSFPCCFHANGSAKDSGVKEPILRYLKLNDL